MGAMTKRLRDANGNITQLDLTQAAAGSRRFQVAPPKNHRFAGFSWVRSTNEAADVQVIKVDKSNSDKLYLVEERLGDTSLDGSWSPPEEEISGLDVDKPSDETGFEWRLQFGQTAGACAVDAVATYKGV